MKNHINKVHKTKKFSTLKVLGFAPFRVMPKFKTFLTFFIFSYNIFIQFQECKQKNHRDSLFRESRLFDMLLFTAPIVRLHKRKVFAGFATLTTFEKVDQTFTIA